VYIETSAVCCKCT